MADGAEGTQATLDDWRVHLRTLFPEARLNNTLEVRGVDAQPNDLVCAVPALWKGLLYDEQALSGVEQLISPLDAARVMQARPSIAQSGLRARLADRPVQSWAEDVVELAEGGLQRQGALNDSGRDESIHLAHLKTLLAAGQTPADALLSNLEDADDLEGEMIARTRV